MERRRSDQRAKAFNRDQKATLLQIGRYVRDVVSCQPTRRYVHAFTIYGREMEICVQYPRRAGAIYTGNRRLHGWPGDPRLSVNSGAVGSASRRHQGAQVLIPQSNILHRDISENNIIIIDSKMTGVMGMLTDRTLPRSSEAGAVVYRKLRGHCEC